MGGEVWGVKEVSRVGDNVANDIVEGVDRARRAKSGTHNEIYSSSAALTART